MFPDMNEGHQTIGKCAMCGLPLNRIGCLRREAARLLGVQSLASLSHRRMAPATAGRHSSVEENGVCVALADFQLAAALASAGAR